MSQSMQSMSMKSHNSPWTEAFQNTSAQQTSQNASADKQPSAEQTPTHDALALVYNRTHSDPRTP